MLTYNERSRLERYANSQTAEWKADPEVGRILVFQSEIVDRLPKKRGAKRIVIGEEVPWENAKWS
jgi:hypothetical protein